MFGILGNKMSGIFTLNPNEAAKVNTPSAATQNPDLIQKGETYEHWGIRICGQFVGSLPALPTSLQRVFGYMYKQQAENVEYQEQARKNTQASIDQKNDEIDGLKKKIGQCEGSISKHNENIGELKRERQEIKADKEKVNKEQRLKLIIGLLIIIPLTVYLFLFYSSTFYSAFFRQAENVTNVMNSMFDPKALENAAHDGFFELCLLLTAPIIFMGLGFCLHFFSVQKGMGKYAKMGAILLVTVLFDCILAYLIGKQLHDLATMIGQAPMGEKYTVGMAISDPNTWAVIFCGFIVYIIWGIVFDMCMTAYNKMDWNKTRIEEIRKETAALEQHIDELKADIDKHEADINKVKKEIKDLMDKLGKQTYINYPAIKMEMTNFFNGWLQQMKLLKCPQEDMTQANEIFKENISTLIPED